jgi:hypothetical protein
MVRTRESGSAQTYKRSRQGIAVGGEDNPLGIEKRSLTDPRSRGLSRTDSRTNTPESYETHSEGPNAPNGQPGKVSYTMYNEYD